MPSDVVRLERYIDRSGGLFGCWPWTGGMQRDGYGKANIRRGDRFVTRDAHRALYELLVGPVPAGLELDHLCRNRRCVNPVHLEPVTHHENLRRISGIGSPNGATETHCRSGHERTPENTYMGSRYPACRQCNRDAVRRYQARKRQGVTAA